MVTFLQIKSSSDILLENHGGSLMKDKVLRYDALMHKEDKTRVLVAMSGGVDSSVAAALLKKQGHKMAGAFMHFWAEKTQIYTDNKERNTDEHGIRNKCCSAEAERIARQAAAKLGIPFYVFHFEDEFKKAVVDYFLEEFGRGRTPNPCVVCNRDIKFGLLFKKMMALGFNYLATGHYARISKFVNSQEIRYSLISAKDRIKDQTYFLWNLKQKQLARLLFPIGNYTKKEVYDLAKKWNLPYRKAESFDICFIAGKDHNEFLKKYLKMKPGPIVDAAGKTIGQHEGLPLYTIGQRRDIGVGATGPYFVIKKNQAVNTLFVTNKPFDRRLYKKSLIAKEVNWISGQAPKLPLKCQARIRYGHSAVPAVINVLSKLRNPEDVRDLESRARLGQILKSYKVIFNHSQRAVTPGQSAVFCQGQEVLGGGVIM